MTDLWSQAGSVARFEASGAHDTDTTQGQELVFIGTGLHADLLRTALTDCLLTEGEVVPSVDPFPEWDTYGIDDTCEYEHAEPVSRA